ncbi:DUF3093 domain-containing protein [Actinobacteria bacterium YIM 96077]|uniref:DUF3093 domain-containing protein n=1 Tax=Phytoactinopolyspora halophila TaxID=1981511 RepID=A0A329QFS4_9ACTN|nr:DUF3093 domain-containing protein [Phytoactinopolyspora halophila]AYY13427.1 DUF3093 domain-containing protein [Actinobacteria bacterium YIM 96077]RAW10821.1 DUF3093 domain-containing protein [Phytoactinopolyspora halophila]
MTREPGTGEPLYRERLFVPARWWLLLVLLAGAIWLIYQHAYGPRVSLPVALPGLACGAAVLVLYGRARLTVTADVVAAGRARLPLDAVGTVEVLTGDAARWARGPELDPRAYRVIRGYVDPVVRIHVSDDDPTPYWLVSSRRPDRFAAAIGTARAARTSAGSS